MTAPLFLLDRQDLADAAPGLLLDLAGPEGRHAATVRRVSTGEAVDVADGSGRLVRCRVASTARDVVRLLVEDVEDVPAPDPRFVLVQALAKGGRDELAVELATEIGVDAVVPWQARRSVVVWSGERGERSRAKWADAVRSAAKQARRPWVPVVEPACDTSALARRCRQADAVLVLHEAAAEPLAQAQVPSSGEVLIVVGPEGGIDDAELEALAAAGGRAVRLGDTVLRSSTAGAAALAVLCARTGRW